MTTLKIYSQNKPLKINGCQLTTVETYNINDGINSNSTYYSEFNTNDYNRTRTKLEKEGYTAHPASYKEIESSIYTVFQEAV